MHIKSWMKLSALLSFSLFMVISVQNLSFAEQEDESFERLAQTQHVSIELFHRIYKKFGPDARHLSTLEACGMSEIKKRLEPDMQEIRMMIIEDFRGKNNLKYKDQRAEIDALIATEQAWFGYKIGYTESLKINLDGLPKDYCEKMPNIILKGISEKKK